VIFIELCNRLEEYAQQSQPSGMRWGIDSPFPLLEIIKRLSGAVEYLLHRKDYDGPDYEELQICIKEAKKFISESSPAGAAEGASEGMAEAWVIEYDNDTGSGDEYFVEWFNVTNGEKSFRCNSKEDAEFLLASLSPGVEDGSGWVKVEDRLPENAGWVNDTVMFWSKKHGHALIGCYDFEFDDWTQQPWTEGAEKLKSSDVTHWRPLPTPPGE
jgi:hypothetical protein